MHTYKMIGVADENGRTYISPYGTYSKKTGFVPLRKLFTTDLFDSLFHEDCWQLKREAKRMTIGEIEEALGYPVEITDMNIYKGYADLFSKLYGGGR